MGNIERLPYIGVLEIVWVVPALYTTVLVTGRLIVAVV
jgi:hypothetical protein